MKRSPLFALAALALVELATPRAAQACGGFFCSAQPVDQNAERIIFSVDEAKNTTDMIVQITYQGDDDAFAWILPVPEVPQNRQVFPAMAMSSFDAQTGPQFQPLRECQTTFASVDAGSRASSPPSSPGGGSVIVHVMERIEGYEVAVIESADSEATFAWLLANQYRLSAVMKPYIEQYTRQGMKFLALKLTANASVRDIKPFKMTLSGTTPSIPLRLTAVAAEPEMGVVVWILGQRRYEPANAVEFDIPKEELRWRPFSFPVRTNWSELVARRVDQEGGKAWVVEQAGSTATVFQAAQSSPAFSEEQGQARLALIKLLTDRPYMTRLYTRVAAEEMSYDPVFRQSSKGDVNRLRELPYVPELCTRDAAMPSYDECDFSSCGQTGVCREVTDKITKAVSAACACPPGTTARTTFDPQGRPVVTCQDQRMSFMNPGERDESGTVFSDPCVGFACGDHGKCVAMNLTPTCVCEEGYVAVASFSDAGTRGTTCVTPDEPLPKGFYNRRPPALADGVVAGRAVELPPAQGMADQPMPDHYGDPMPAVPPKKSRDDDDGCSVAPGASSQGWVALASLWLGAVTLLSRRRSPRRRSN